MKKRVFRALLLTAFAFLLIPCTNTRALTVKKNNAHVYVVKDRKTRMNVSANKTGTKLRWRSKNTKVIQAKNDIIKGIKTGTGSIYTKLNQKQLNAKVTVMSLNQTEIVIPAGKTKKLEVVNGATVKWSSSRKKIADVKKGVVKAYQTGVAYITAKSHGRKMQCKVRVPGVRISSTMLTLAKDYNTATVTPLNFVGETTVTSSDPAVIKIDKEGKLHALKAGYSIIQVTGEGITVSQRVEVNSLPVDIFMGYMNKYNNYVKKYGKQFNYGWSPTQPFYNVKATIKAKKTAYICCNAPIRWAFAEMGFSSYKIWAVGGKFPNTVFKGTMKKYLTRITASSSLKKTPIGMTIRKAVAAGYLKAGDIIAFKGITHAFVYSGKNFIMLDGGRSAKTLGYSKVGISVDYRTVEKYQGKTISQILRWKTLPMK